MQIIFILCQHEVAVSQYMNYTYGLIRDLHLYKASLVLYAYSLMYTFTNLTIHMQIFMA